MTTQTIAVFFKSVASVSKQTRGRFFVMLSLFAAVVAHAQPCNPDLTNPQGTGHTDQFSVAPGQCAITITQNMLTPPVVMDNCTPVGQIVVTTNFVAGSYAVGSYSFLWFVQDEAGNTGQVNSHINVTDSEPPVAICPAVPPVVLLDISGSGTLSANSVGGGLSTDNCSGVIESNPSQNYTCSDRGIRTVVLTATDISNNTNTTTCSINVVDNISPIAVCPSIPNVILNSSGSGTLPANIGGGLSTDNCPGVSETSPAQTLTCQNVGARTVVLTATDASGNTGTANCTFTVVDNTKPNAICQNITVQLNASGNITITGSQVNNGSNDACGINTLVVNHSTFTCDSVGTRTVILTVTDVNGNSNTCSASVTVQDLVPPNALCRNISVTLNGSGNASIIASQIDNGSTDACGIASRTVAPNTFNCSNVATPATVTLTVTDVNGNINTCTATVTVQDLSTPTITCPISITIDNAPGQCGRNYNLPATATDNCQASVVLTYVPPSGSFFPVGTTPVTATATDAGNNSASCTFNVTVRDTSKPVITCPQNFSVSNSTGQCGAVVTYTPPATATDNCVSVTITYSPVSGSFFPVGTTTVTATATDAANNSKACTFTVSVNETEKPAITCPPDISVNAGQTNCQATVNIIAPTISDNCPGVTASNNFCPVGNCVFPVGPTTVIWTATDASGNTRTCSQTVTVNDLVNPLITCPPDITQNTDPGICTANVTVPLPTNVSDNCTVISVINNKNNGANASGIYPQGTTTVIWTVTDQSNNKGVCDHTVTITDAERPAANCKNITVQLNLTSATITPGDVNNGSSDNCTAANALILSVSKTSFDCSNIGNNFVVLTVADASGNSTTCNATITVQDVTPPAALCKNLTVQLNTVAATITSSDVNNGSTDNCTAANALILSVSKTSFDCSNLGSNTVVLTVRDASNNSSTCTATVTVQDITPPTANCKNYTIQLIGNTATIISSDGNNGSTDNCTSVSALILSLSKTSFDCSNVGSNLVTLTVTDASGNTSTCSTTITVQDKQPPSAICQNVTVQLDNRGSAFVTGIQVNNGSTDNCGGQLNFSVSPSVFNCTNVTMTNTVTLTVTDAGGNTSVCNAIITVQDLNPPLVRCQNITVQLGTNGTVTVTGLQIDGGSTDNCGIAGYAASPNSFDCTDLGPNTVTLTVTDVGGTTATCTAIVTVEDGEDPVARCRDIVRFLGPSGSVSLTPNDINNGSTDNCGIANMFVFPNSLNCPDVMVDTVALIVIDNYGNVGFCTSIVTLLDTVKPVARCRNITAQLDVTGNVVVRGTDVDNSSTDNCEIDTMKVNPNSFTCLDVGVRTVTLIVEDNSGNVSTCSARVTVEDNVAPNAQCKNIVVRLDNTGNATITGADIDDGSTDACGIQSMVPYPSAFDCDDVGDVQVTLLVTDINNVAGTCTSTVTVLDTTKPVAVCKDITVQLDGSGNAAITGADINNGSSDACGIRSLSPNPAAFDCADVGDVTVTLIVTDNNGNVSTCSSTVTVEDKEAPAARCKNIIIVQLDASGNATITGADMDNGSTDNCRIDTLIASPNNFDCLDIGNNTVTLVVKDVNGNESTCTGTAIVEDKVKPIVVCRQGVVVQLDASGSVTITVNDIDGGSTDNCGIAGMTLNDDDYTCANAGPNVVTLTVTDVNGNTASCSTTITVEDNINPTASCKQGVVVQLDASGNASITVNDIEANSADNCGVTGRSLDEDGFTCADVGPFVVTLTVTDANGNTGTCSTTVLVEDNLPPSASCSNITVQLNASGSVSITVQNIDAGSSDNCSIANRTLSESNFTCADIGSNTVVLTVTDASGNSGTCSATVTVQDLIPPTVTCKNATVQLDAAGDADITTSDIEAASSDNCSIINKALSEDDFSCADIGANAVTLTVTDAAGNTAQCNATVTVQDNLPPSVTCKNATLQLDASGDVTLLVGDVEAGSSDNCGIATSTLSENNFSCSDIGANAVTLTVADVNGNSASCSAVVTVEDNLPPTTSCQNITISLNASGDASIVVNDIDAGSSDNCSISSRTLSEDDFDCNDAGQNVVTLTVTDASGNTGTCSATVTVEDNLNPAAACLNITIQLDASGNVSIAENDIDNGSSDNCGISNKALSDDDFTCTDAGPNVVTLTVTDLSGNTGTCSAIVTVEDNIPPTALCRNFTILTDARGNASVTAQDINNGSSDACGIANLTLDKLIFTCADIGANTVTLTVTDNNGNTATCQAVVTVINNTDPTAICEQGFIVDLDASGNATITGDDIGSGSTDACGIDSLIVIPNTFDCSDIGPNTVTLIVENTSGEMDYCATVITVRDSRIPDALCKNIVAYLDANGTASIDGSDIDNGSTDNCGIDSIEAIPNTFICGNIGDNRVALIVTDVNGNLNVCFSTVTVLDTIAPDAKCKNITVQLDPSGNATIVAAQIDDGSTDNCGQPVLTANPNTFDCGDVGDRIVTLIVSDLTGNFDFCSATVTVEDNISPVAVCKNHTAYLDASGNVTITGADIDNGSSDACGIANRTVSPDVFDCSDVGTLQSVTLTVTDSNGNNASCFASVTVRDTVAPDANCKAATVYLNASGIGNLTPAQVDNASADACGLSGLTLSEYIYVCDSVGLRTVILTVKDNNGNTSTCAATVSVQDTVMPVARCKDITVQLNAVTHTVSITGAEIDNFSSDACGIDSLMANPNIFGCGDIGTNQITLIVKDKSGSTDFCTATVTVENSSPVAVCRDATVQLDVDGEGILTAAQIDSNSSIACGPLSFSLSRDTFDCSDVGVVHVVALIVTSPNGSDACSANVTVVDNIPPLAKCRNLTLVLDAAGSGSITASQVDNGSSDACGIISLSATPTSFTCANVGSNNVVLTVKDANNNTSTCIATVTWQTNAQTCNDNNLCTIDICGPNGCVNTPVNCDDNNACTDDRCLRGLCDYTPKTCVDGDLCTTDGCVPATGCVFIPIVCNDFSACTKDTCVQGLCQYVPITCNDNNACTLDSCKPATGCFYTVRDCNDNSACTIDGCNPVSGCTNTPVNCTDDFNACTINGCDPTSGCTYLPRDCNDRNACTEDYCDIINGCYYINVDCNDFNVCSIETCNPATGCVYRDTVCNDNNACTVDGCNPPVAGCTYLPVNCDDFDACTLDSCDVVEGCFYTAVDCDDNDVCTTNECDISTGCYYIPDCYSNPGLCCNDNNPCTDDVCVGSGGQCVNYDINCDDYDECTSDQCVNGVCQFTSIICNDNNACTTDACNTQTGCTHAALNCNDQNACTTDACNTQTGCTHATLNCDDQSVCTTDACNTQTGCTHATLNCNDQNACTTDACNTQTGCTHATLNCNDQNACTTDACNTQTGCTHATLNCDDQNVCTTDACNTQTGCTHATLNCNDQNACTTDNCNPSSGCITTAVICDDHNACTNNTCVNGVCQYPQINCDDQNPCTTDQCVNGNCTHTGGGQINATVVKNDVSCNCQQNINTLNPSCVLSYDNLVHGEFISNQFAGMGIHIRGNANNHSGALDTIIVFNSNRTGTPDPDLEVGLGNLLILPNNITDNNHDGIVDVPNDWSGGGTQTFIFDSPHHIQSFIFVDNDQNLPGLATAYGAANNVIASVSIPITADGGIVTVNINASGVRKLVISQNGSGGAVGKMIICEPEACCNGTASASTTGGTPPYAFHWSNGTNSATATGLCPGTYYVTITDFNGCSTVKSVTVGNDVCNTPCTPESCEDNNVCTSDVCAGSQCIHTTTCTRAQCSLDEQCDDQIVCTNDACVNGTCQSTPIINCGSSCDNMNCDDGEPCTYDDCENGQCVYTCNTNGGFDLQWQKALGGKYDEEANSVFQTNDGGYLVAGYTWSNNGDVSGNHGQQDFWVVKLNSGGNLLWQKALGSRSGDVATSACQASDGGYVVAGYSKSNNGNVSGNHGQQDFWIVKLSSAGSLLWQKSLGGSNADFANAVAQTSDGGYILAGSTSSGNGDVSVNHGVSDFWIVKTDALGNIVWQKTLGGTKGDIAYSVFPTSDGGYVAAGSTASNDGDVSGNHGGDDYWVIKLNAAGSLVWQKTLGGNKDDVAKSVMQTSNGGYVVAGSTYSNNGDVTGNHGGEDYWVVNLDAGGNINWQKTLGGSGKDGAQSIVQTNGGGFAVVGKSTSNNGDVSGNHGGYDYWMAQMDNSGNLTWKKSFGGTSDDKAFSVKQTSDGGFVLAGSASSNNGDVSGSHGKNDFWVVKVGPELNCVPIIYESVVLCSGEEITVGGSVQTTAGIYYDTLPRLNGCDSIVVTTVTVVCDDNNPCTHDICLGSQCAHENIIGCGTQQCDMQVTGFTLVYESTFGDIAPLTNGLVISRDTLCRFNVRADVCGQSARSVKFYVNGIFYWTESIAPYSIAGDNPPGNYRAWIPLPGNYTITAIPYDQPYGNGLAGTSLSVSFTVLQGTSLVRCTQPTSIDCHGEINGSAFIDTCGICAGGATRVVPNMSCARGEKMSSEQPGSLPVDGAVNKENGMMLFAYPNPFKDQLNIEFSLPEDSEVKLEVYSVSGQKLAVLFEGDAEANRFYKFEYRPAHHSGGMIFYRLQTNTKTWIDKAVLME